MINQSYDQINKGSVFSKIKTNIDWLGVNSEKELSLNIVKYKQEQAEVKNTYKQLDELSKLTKELNVKNVPSDTVAINAAKDKMEKNKAWLKRISGDIYVDETLKVINNMILQKATAKNN